MRTLLLLGLTLIIACGAPPKRDTAPAPRAPVSQSEPAPTLNTVDHKEPTGPLVRPGQEPPTKADNPKVIGQAPGQRVSINTELSFRCMTAIRAGQPPDNELARKAEKAVIDALPLSPLWPISLAVRSAGHQVSALAGGSVVAINPAAVGDGVDIRWLPKRTRLRTSWSLELAALHVQRDPGITTVAVKMYLKSKGTSVASSVMCAEFVDMSLHGGTDIAWDPITVSQPILGPEICVFECCEYSGTLVPPIFSFVDLFSMIKMPTGKKRFPRLARAQSNDQDGRFRFSIPRFLENRRGQIWAGGREFDVVLHCDK